MEVPETPPPAGRVSAPLSLNPVSDPSLSRATVHRVRLCLRSRAVGGEMPAADGMTPPGTGT